MNREPSAVRLRRHHPLLARLRRLRRDPALREAEGVFVAEGPRLAREAIDAGAEVDTVVFSPRLASTDAGAALQHDLVRLRCPCFEVGESAMDSIQDARAPQPVLLLVRRPDFDARRALAAAGPDPLVLVAEGIQDPGNLGSMLRTASAAGAGAALVVGGADPLHARAVRASAGAIFRLPIGRPDGTELDALLAEQRLRVWAASPSGEVAFDEADLTGGAAIVFGSEGAGLSAERVARADGSLRIPMSSGVESLSVSAAAAVVLIAAARQRAAVSPGEGS